jgi:D-alanyl-D-alanine dipeptidase
MNDDSRCVDDRRSRYYNRIVERGKVTKDWRSAERMKFPSGLYRYGIFVAHNPRNVPGAGSCIFMHIKKSNGRPTVGCTAMGQKELLEVMRWLDPEKNPVLVQAPRSVVFSLLPGNFQLTQVR